MYINSEDDKESVNSNISSFTEQKVFKSQNSLKVNNDQMKFSIETKISTNQTISDKELNYVYLNSAKGEIPSKQREKDIISKQNAEDEVLTKFENKLEKVDEFPLSFRPTGKLTGSVQYLGIRI